MHSAKQISWSARKQTYCHILIQIYFDANHNWSYSYLDEGFWYCLNGSPTTSVLHSTHTTHSPTEWIGAIKMISIVRNARHKIVRICAKIYLHNKIFTPMHAYNITVIDGMWNHFRIHMIFFIICCFFSSIFIRAGSQQ